MNKIPKFDDVAWNGGPEVDHRSTDWRARAVAQAGRPLDQLASYTPEQIPINPSTAVPISRDWSTCARCPGSRRS